MLTQALGRNLTCEEELPGVLSSIEESLLSRRTDGFADWTLSIDILKAVFTGKYVGLESSACSLHDLWIRSQSYYCSTVEYCGHALLKSGKSSGCASTPSVLVSLGQSDTTAIL